MSDGTCRRSFPRSLDKDGRGVWPLTWEDDQCGAFGAKAAEGDVGARTSGRPKLISDEALASFLDELAPTFDKAVTASALLRVARTEFAVGDRSFYNMLQRAAGAGTIMMKRAEGKATVYWAANKSAVMEVEV